MTEEEFNRQMLFVDTLYGENSDYAINYKRALRRRYHRVFYGTDLEYTQQLIMMGRSTEMGRGHRDGLAGREPIPNDALICWLAWITFDTACELHAADSKNMIELRRGESYPLPLEQGEGAAAQFLTKTGNVLQIVLPDMDSKEQNALRSGLIKAGFLYDGGAMLFLFQFYGNDGKPLITFDAPFDIRLLSAAERNLHNIDNAEQRLAIEIHAIDEKKILRALRLVTMPPDMTLKFLSTVQEQLATIDKPGVMNQWLQHEPSELIKKTETWVLGK